jgi:hypothetical protein
MKWLRRLHSGQEVSYDDLSFKEVVALATALDEWESVLAHRHTFPFTDKGNIREGNEQN